MAANSPTPKEIDQALKIQRLEVDRAMVDMETRIDKRFLDVDKHFAVIDERFKALDWKMNLIIGGIATILIGGVIVPAFRPQSQPAPQQPVIINVPAGTSQQAPVTPPATK